MAELPICGVCEQPFDGQAGHLPGCPFYRVGARARPACNCTPIQIHGPSCPVRNDPADVEKACAFPVREAWDLLISHGKVLVIEAVRAGNWTRVLSLTTALAMADKSRQEAK